MARSAIGVVCLLTILSWNAAAQQPDRFDVASIKRSDVVGDQGPRFLNPEPGGRLRAVNLPVTTLIWIAYSVQSYQVVDAPSWATTDGYDILAKAPDGANGTMDTFRPMLQSLLKDRFQLKIRRETRELPLYNLVLSRRDRTLGSGLTRSATDCTGKTPPPANPPLGSSCGAFVRPGGFTMAGMPIRAFTRLLSPMVNRVVIDQTGLEGTWDLDMSYTPDLAVAGAGDPARPSDGPTLFTALQEQLGLRLDPGRGQVDVLIVESVARPTLD